VAVALPEEGAMLAMVLGIGSPGLQAGPGRLRQSPGFPMLLQLGGGKDGTDQSVCM